MTIETGKIIFMLGFLVLGVLFGSTVGYNIGRASGTLEATVKLEKMQLDNQINETNQTANAYGDIPSDPLQGVKVNPFE